jgi:phosphate transport system substrate-binding protein
MLENKVGKFASPGPESGAAALSATEFPKGTLPGSKVPDLRGWAYDSFGEKSYGK